MMGIIGINYDLCINCGTCLTICRPRLFSRTEEESEKIIFNLPRARACNLCGHCIATCPEDAIFFEGIGESESFKGVDHPEEIADYNIVYKILRANRSTRSYKQDKVPEELLRKVFKAMEMAPTGGNMRLEKFTLLSDQEQLKALSDAIMEELLKDPLTKEVYINWFNRMKKEYNVPVFMDAPHIIFVTSPPVEVINKLRKSITKLGVLSYAISNNIGNIITYGRLAAQALGLGTCYNGLSQAAMKTNPDLKQMIGIQSKITGAFVIGYPNVIFHRTPPRSPKTVKGLN